MRGILNKIDWLLLAPVAFISAAGLVVLRSSVPDLFLKQFYFVISGFILVFLVSFIDLRPFVGSKVPIFLGYIGSILFLLSVPFLGIEVNGSKSWLSLGAVNIQPSEFAKVALIMIFALFFSRRHIGIGRSDVILKSLAYFAVPAVLILSEPDWGSALILFGIWFGFLLVAGLPFRHLALSFLVFAALGAGVWGVGLKDYQKERIAAVFNPEYDPLGINYNVIQSKNAIGSGGWSGKGFGRGEIVQLGFLPAAQTDFAFSSLVEEWGFVGGSLVIFAFTFLIWRISAIGIAAEGNFYKFICLGSVVFLSLHFIVNLGSAIGFFPVVGVVFPLLSYGGSGIVATFMLLSLVNNVSKR